MYSYIPILTQQTAASNPEVNDFKPGVMKNKTPKHYKEMFPNKPRPTTPNPDEKLYMVLPTLSRL